jgi:hypothetical protein
MTSNNLSAGINDNSRDFYHLDTSHLGTQCCRREVVHFAARAFDDISAET